MATGSDHPGAVVMVPVPVSYLQPVYALLGELMSGESKIASPVSTNSAPGNYPVVAWTQAEIMLLHSMPLGAAARAVLDQTAAHVGRRVSFHEIVLQAKQNFSEARGDISSLTKQVKKHFKRINLPFEREYDQKGQAYYFIDPSNAVVADWWKQTNE